MALSQINLFTQLLLKITKVIFSKQSRRLVKPCGAQVPFAHSAPRALTLLEFWQKSLICDSAIIKNLLSEDLLPNPS